MAFHSRRAGPYTFSTTLMPSFASRTAFATGAPTAAVPTEIASGSNRITAPTGITPATAFSIHEDSHGVMRSHASPIFGTSLTTS